MRKSGTLFLLLLLLVAASLLYRPVWDNVTCKFCGEKLHKKLEGGGGKGKEEWQEGPPPPATICANRTSERTACLIVIRVVSRLKQTTTVGQE